MITIQRNKTKMKVSKEAFKLYYEGIGFKEVGVKAEKPAGKPVNEKPKSEEKSEEKPEGKSEEEGKEEGKEEASKTPIEENPKK